MDASELKRRRDALSPEQRRLLEARVRAAASSAAPIDRRPKGARVPLSPAQSKLFAIQQGLPESPLFHIPLSLRVQGPFVPEALEYAVLAVCERHDSLRTTFRVTNGRPLAIVGRRPPRCIEYFDLTSLGSDECVSTARNLARARVSEPFDLVRGPLLRVSVLQLDAEDHVLAITLHHAIADAHSLGILARELSSFYGGGLRGEPPSLAPLPIEFADYVWSRARNGSDAYARHLAYWTRQLAVDSSDAAPGLAFDTHSSDFRTAVHQFHVPQPVADEITKRSAAHAVTPFMYLLAAVKAVLAVHWRYDDIWTATLTANRTLPELEHLVGLLVNTVPLRTRVRERDTFDELLSRVRTTVVDAYDHQEVPFEELADRMRAAGVDPIARIPVLFVLQDTPRPSLSLDTVAIAPFHLHDASAAEGATLTTFAMTMTLTPTSSGMDGSILWRTALVDRESVASIADAYVRMLSNVCRNSTHPLADLVSA